MKEKDYETQKATEFKIKHLPQLLKRTTLSWNDDDPWRLSAVVAYYAILSLPGLILVVIGVASYFWGAEAVEGEVYEGIKRSMGESEAEAIQSIFTNVQETETSWISAVIGIGALVFGATAVFYHLQISLNRIWKVKSDPKSAILRYVIDRTKSLVFVLAIAAMLLVTFIASAMLLIMRDYLEMWFSEITYWLFLIVDPVVSLTVMTLMFALMFKFMPDVHIKWKSVWLGAFITAFLFAVGKEILSYYFGAANPGNVYGAAGSIIIILLWVTYTCLIIFFGAEFTYVITKFYNYPMEPKSHARLIGRYEHSV
jgi:membrane protein